MRHVLASYAEKLLVVLVAVGCFSGISALGHLTDTNRHIKVNEQRLQEIATSAKVKLAPEPEEAAPGQKPTPEGQKVVPPVQRTQRGPNWQEEMTAQELTAHVQHLADAAIWVDHTTEVEKLKKEYVNESKKPTADKQPDINGVFANRLAGEETRTRARVAAAHARIEAAVTQISRKNDALLSRMADEKSSLHVLFEIIWYALMIVGVLGCSYLLMNLFTALPFTSIDGEWTKRIEDILRSATPGAARAIAIAPLAAAAVIGGTVLTGATYATVPGGVSREVVRHEQTIENRPTLNEGSIYDYSDRSTHSMPVEPGLKPHELSSALEQTTRRINGVTSANATSVSECVRDAAGKVDSVHVSVRDVGEKAEGIELLAGAAAAHASNASAGITGVDANINARSNAIVDEQTHQNEVRSNSLVRTAAVDERGFWRRHFGSTQYRIGRSVLDAMTAQMAADKVAERDQLDVQIALEKMTALRPLGRRQFEAALKGALPAPMMACYRRTLLHLSALPIE